MLRLGPEGYMKFIQADRFVLNYTGAEGNVVTSLANMGVPAELVTKLPENAIAECAEANLRKYRVDVNISRTAASGSESSTSRKARRSVRRELSTTVSTRRSRRVSSRIMTGTKFLTARGISTSPG